MAEGILKDLPIIGNLFSIITTSQNIKDWFFAKKIYRFLAELDKVELKHRNKFIDELDNAGKRQRQKVGEELIIILDRLDHLEKADYLGRLFKAYIQHEINYQDFSLMSSMIERIYKNDLISLVNNEIKKEQEQRLYSLGLYSSRVVQAGGFLGAQMGETATVTIYTINRTGNQFIKVIRSSLN
ncbi:hypothetical protein [Paenibacillus albus]|uniref:Uncharacterized protein n=1 Tax=Paenibacillus albus TaxID=2495582 RepID=A0A3Q8X3Y5_9BACL|nr:hypothetical protein [Paenibacillus albus]AZN39925.1 hypothetical protein EJC50_09890 [Paenibacillus albus]